MVTRIVKTPPGKKSLPAQGVADDALLAFARQVGTVATEAALHAARLVQENMSKTAAVLAAAPGGEGLSPAALVVSSSICQYVYTYPSGAQRREQLTTGAPHLPATGRECPAL